MLLVSSQRLHGIIFSPCLLPIYSEKKCTVRVNTIYIYIFKWCNLLCFVAHSTKKKYYKKIQNMCISVTATKDSDSDSD